MRALLAALVAATLLAGCASTDFRTLAMAAPGLLQADVGPSGSLMAQTGTMSVEMVMTDEGGETYTMGMEATMDMKFLQEASALMTMHVTGIKINGKPMGMTMTMTMFCSPQKIVVEMMGETETMANPAGSCQSDAQHLMRAAEGMDSEMSQLMSMMGMAGTYDLKFVGVEHQEGKDIAVYDTTADMDMSDLQMSFKLTTRAQLDGARISKMATSGTAELGGEGMSMTMVLTADSDLVYGAREPVPAKYA